MRHVVASAPGVRYSPPVFLLMDISVARASVFEFAQSKKISPDFSEPVRANGRDSPRRAKRADATWVDK